MAIETTWGTNMDPRHTQCFVVAQKELQDLFRELSVHGLVGSAELQQALLPFTAGDAKRDLLELIRDLSRRHTSLDEHEFVRVLWRKMYVNNVTMPGVDLSGRRGRNGDPNDVLSSAFTVPLAHVIVSIKRRSQLYKFATYYTNRGISGADTLTLSKVSSIAPSLSSPPLGKKNARPRAQLRSAVTAQSQPDTVSTMSVQALRQRKVKSLDVVACAFDAESRAMKAYRLLSRFERYLICCTAFHSCYVDLFQSQYCPRGVLLALILSAFNQERWQFCYRQFKLCTRPSSFVSVLISDRRATFSGCSPSMETSILPQHRRSIYHSQPSLGRHGSVRNV